MKANKSPVSILALGGLEEVGKNTYVIKNDKDLILIDAGVKFPGDILPGIDYVIPDYTYLKNNRHQIKALFITHGHEDHIGGIPFLIRTVYVPVIYAPRLAASLIRNKLDMMRIKEPVTIIEYDADSIINVGDFKVSFFRVTHSIPDAYGIVVDTSEGRIIETGDFKIDLTPVGPDFEINKLASIGKEGVDLLMSDSTNAEVDGYTPSETSVLAAIEDIFFKSEGRIIVSTFSSNISRIQQVVETAVKYGRKITIVGRSMENTVMVSRKYGYIKIPDDSIIEPELVRNYKLNQICVLCTGSQGEEMAALSRIAKGEHNKLRLIPGDTVVFSSSPIPGNGPSIEKIINLLYKKGANVITNDILFNLHSSGHPSKQELRLMLKLVDPRYFMPIHGEYRMLKIHADIGNALGIPKENTFILKNGESIILQNHVITKGPKFSAEPIYLDGTSTTAVSDSILRERYMMKEDGIVIITLNIDFTKKSLRTLPHIYTRGFIYTSTHKVIDDTANKVKDKINEYLSSPDFNVDVLKSEIKDVTKKYLFRKTERKPIVIPLILGGK